MKLNNKNKTYFELNILNYQFPALTTETYDSNWLMIQIKVKHPKGEWQSTDPTLLTYEAKEIADWLEKIAKNESVENTLAFIEPNLSFELLEEKKYIRIYFEAESRPSWVPSKEDVVYDLWLDIEIDNDKLTEAAEDLRNQLLKYPQRAEK